MDGMNLFMAFKMAFAGKPEKRKERTYQVRSVPFFGIGLLAHFPIRLRDRRLDVVMNYDKIQSKNFLLI